MRRREFLILGGGAALLGAGVLVLQRWPRLVADTADGAAGAAPLPPQLQGPGGLGRGGWEVLRGWRGTGPLEAAGGRELQTATLAELQEALLRRLRPDRAAGMDAATFAARLRVAVTEDFRAGRLCEGSTWVLSETECIVARLRAAAFGPAALQAGERELRPGVIARVSDWGPRETLQDTPVNVQSDGHSGIWIKAPGAPAWTEFEIAGERVPTQPGSSVITTGLYGALQDRVLGRPGRYPVALIDAMAGLRQEFGVFVVHAREADGTAPSGPVLSACAVSDWGPQGTRVGAPANPQPDGSEALWIRVACVPRGVRVFLGGEPLATTPGEGLITARVPLTRLEKPAKLAVELRAGAERMRVGTYTIR